MPVPHADEHGQRRPDAGQRLLEPSGLRERQLGERRATTRHLLVVVGDLVQPPGGNVPPARDDLQEGPDLVGRRRSAEGDQQHRVDAPHRRSDSS